MQKTLLFLSLFALLSACNEDPTDTTVEPVVESPFVEDDLLGCNQFEVMETEGQFAINALAHIATLGRYFVYGPGDELVIREGFNGPVIHRADAYVNGLETFNNYLFICSNRGLERLDQNGQIEVVSTQDCNSIVVDANNRLLVQGSFGAPQTTVSRSIHEYKNGTLVPFANVNNNFSCVSIRELKVDARGQLFGLSCQNEIGVYQNGSIAAFYEPTESPFFFPASNDFLLDVHQGEITLITQNVTEETRIFKYRDGVWCNIFELGLNAITEASRKRTRLFFRFYNNTYFHDDFLYVFSDGNDAETGILRFDLSEEGVNTPEVVELVQFNAIASSSYIIDMVTANDGYTYIVLNDYKIVKLTC